MARQGTVSPVELDGLRDAYLEMQERKAAIRAQVREEYRAKIKAEIESRSEIAERTFAVQLVRLREAGATRAELVDIIGDGTAATMRRYVELGGGNIAVRKTSEDRKEERAKGLGVYSVDGETFDLEVGQGADGGTLCIPVTIKWRDGKPFMWPVFETDVVPLRDTYGYSQEDLFSKGAEIVAAFGVTEGA